MFFPFHVYFLVLFISWPVFGLITEMLVFRLISESLLLGTIRLDGGMVGLVGSPGVLCTFRTVSWGHCTITFSLCYCNT